MAVNLQIQEPILPIAGVRLATAAAGIRKSGAPECVLIEIAQGSSVAGMFTQNAFCAAPVQICRQHLQTASARYLLINAGNANCGTGSQGLGDARQLCQQVADLTATQISEVLPFSTGVIGAYLPVDKISAVLPQLHATLDADQWQNAARAIMTTDTVPKVISTQVRLSSGTLVSSTGIAKGAGMICPNMATMLAYIAVDAAVSQPLLNHMWQQLVADSFNAVSVDGDTSTNDSAILIATGKAQNTPLDMAALAPEHPQHADYLLIYQQLNDICGYLAQALVRDGEGASKFVAIKVTNGASVAECRQVAYQVAHSPLCKTALFASDPNWGRILAAVGNAKVANLNTERVNIAINGVDIVRNGERAGSYTEEQGVVEFAKAELEIDIDLARGAASACVYSCDLGHEYVRINAEYRS